MIARLDYERLVRVSRVRGHCIFAKNIGHGDDALVWRGVRMLRINRDRTYGIVQYQSLWRALSRVNLFMLIELK